ncbi:MULTISPECIES: ABC transporter permease [Streptomyces]|uniref:ABC transporter permease n=1 Tax=Streptomyces TaxID=1883 RepID=UPI00073DDF96|nr:ABC transporter permease [Streptomyces sp. FBKL.4005]MYU28062.1 ABC transporter permease [Streptomyces sp. SID7810]OYP18945.1 ABC transporter permease [Streptomyces sp. FBKL.4005]CUW26938.1 ABC-2 family transporter protein [Streptomyces reticuli]
MPFAPVLHAEWIKIRTLRSLLGALAAILVATAAFSALAAADADGSDPLFSVFFGVSFGQIAAIAFGTTAVSSEFRGGALRLSLAAVPDRGRWFAAKATAIALPALAVGLLTGFVTLLVGRAVLGTAAPGWTEGLRGAVGCALHLTLMALFAAGLAAVLRSGVATLSVLIPFLLIVSFVIGDLSGSAADFLPDRAGQVALHSSWDGALGPWSGLAVTALWTAAALLAGAWSVRRRDA